MCYVLIILLSQYLPGPGGHAGGRPAAEGDGPLPAGPRLLQVQGGHHVQHGQALQVCGGLRTHGASGRHAPIGGDVPGDRRALHNANTGRAGGGLLSS